MKISTRTDSSVSRDISQPWIETFPDWLAATYDAQVNNGIELFQIGVDRRPDGPAIHYFDTTLSHVEVDAHSHALACELRERGIQNGDRVGIYLQNDPQFVIALYAIWLAGGVVVALNPMLKPRELNYQLTDSGASIVICLDGLYQTVQESLKNAAVKCVLVTSERAFAPDEKSLEKTEKVESSDGRLEDIFNNRAGERITDIPQPRGDDPALLCFTSGTTGPPKAAILTHTNFAYGEVYHRVARVGPEDVVMAGAPLFHVTGITGHIVAARLSAIPLVLFHRFEACNYLRMVERWRPTFSILALTAYIAILECKDFGKRDISSLTKIFTGGAPVSPAMVERFEDATGLYMHNTYGMTETSSPTHMVPFGMRAPVDPKTGAISVGLPVPNLMSEIRDLETDEPAVLGDIGQIVSRGPGVVAGYWNRPEETEKALSDGFMHTGDVGAMNDAGWFFLVDRAKDMIVVSGYKVWPREVEDVLYEHPAVREAAVVGEEDDYRGETVVAFVSIREGYEGVTPQDLIDHCKSLLSAYKYPRRITIIPEVPKTATGKFLRRELRS